MSWRARMEQGEQCAASLDPERSDELVLLGSGSCQMSVVNVVGGIDGGVVVVERTDGFGSPAWSMEGHR